MDTVRYKKKTFDYEKENLVVGHLPDISHDDAKELLFCVQDLFEEKGIKLYLGYGTLLGAIREGDFIKGDYDLDVYIKDENLFFDSLGFFEENGLKLVRARPNLSYSFRYKGNKNCYIDVIIMGRLKSLWGIYCCKIGNYVTARYRVKNDTQIDFLGRKFDCAENPVELLKFWYGDTWNIPLSKAQKQYTYEEKSYHIYRRIKYYIFKYPLKNLLRVVLGGKGFDKVKTIIQK